MRIIVHGGAGSPPDEPTPRQDVLDKAATTGCAAETPLAAVEAAIGVLESSPRFNAGTGSALQTDGVARTDAGVMTSDRSIGAACNMPGVENAVSVARAVLETTPHIMLAGVHAVDLAADAGIATDVDLSTEQTRERYTETTLPNSFSGQREWACDQFGTASSRDHDTVGAVAVDGGQIAAATSTGGRWLALRGRVGDVPQVGAGFYATPAGGASTTGAGEDIARVTLARRAVDELTAGKDAPAAAVAAIEEFESLTDSSAGVIVADRDGNTGAAYCSDAMQTATAHTE